MTQTHTPIHTKTYTHTYTHTHAHTHTNTNTYNPHINLSQRVHGVLKKKGPILLSGTLPSTSDEWMDIRGSKRFEVLKTNGTFLIRSGQLMANLL